MKKNAMEQQSSPVGTNVYKSCTVEKEAKTNPTLRRNHFETASLLWVNT
jgi:hypothetical protein